MYVQITRITKKYHKICTYHQESRFISVCIIISVDYEKILLFAKKKKICICQVIGRNAPLTVFCCFWIKKWWSIAGYNLCTEVTDCSCICWCWVDGEVSAHEFLQNQLVRLQEKMGQAKCTPNFDYMHSNILGWESVHSKKKKMEWTAVHSKKNWSGQLYTTKFWHFWSGKLCTPIFLKWTLSALQIFWSELEVHSKKFWSGLEVHFKFLEWI
jgi:hypothetical protein